MDDNRKYAAAIAHYEARDFAIAFAAFSELALRDHAESISLLASMYAAGEGVTQDIAKSMELDLKAIGLGSLTSRANLAVTLLQIGKPDEAEFWFREAIAAGDDDANLDLAKLKLSQNAAGPEVPNLLRAVVASDTATPASKEEAEEILRAL